VREKVTHLENEADERGEEVTDRVKHSEMGDF